MKGVYSCQVLRMELLNMDIDPPFAKVCFWPDFTRSGLVSQGVDL